MMNARHGEVLTPINAYDREKVTRLNRAIDEALRDPRTCDAGELRTLAGKCAAAELAERVRRRAVRLGARVPDIATRRDALIAAVYASVAPRGWFSAWCDGAVSRAPDGLAGIGVVVIDPRGTVLSRLARSLASADTFAAEIGAVAAALETTLEAGAARLCVYTDCAALVRLWTAHRLDPRLDVVRTLARRLQRVRIFAVPRGHNQAAHALARKAMQRELRAIVRKP